MAEKQQIWTESYKIASYLVNLKNRAGLYSILNLVQDVGWLHGIHLQVSLPKNQNWVFTRQKLVMQQWPLWNETVTIRTWLRPPVGFFLYRDYEIFLGDTKENKKIGQCTSTLAIMDLQTRKIVDADWSQYDSIWRPNGHLSQIAEKIILNSKLQDMAQFQVRNSDLDMNQHVNNTKYAQWILDAVPLDVIQSPVSITDYEVNFLAECKSGDWVQVLRTMTDSTAETPALTQFQGLRVADKKPVFTAQIRIASN